MKKLLFCLILGTASPALANGPTGPGTTPPVTAIAKERASIGQMLAMYHKTPSKQAFDAVSKRAPELLLGFATQADLMPAHRSRALDALGAYYPDARVRMVFANIATTAQNPTGLRHDAMLLGARYFGKDFVPTLSTTLSDSDLQIRYTAVEALANIGDPTALASIKKALSVETSTFVRKRMEDALRTIR